MNSTDSTLAQIDVRAVLDGERINTLPRHFGRHLMQVESAVYGFMRRFSHAYRGGYWTFFELSNGGFYMAPEDGSRFALCIDTNGYEGEMSADAVGITVCLFALSHLSFLTVDEGISEHFYWLRDFALQHPEAREIFAAID